MYPITWQNGYDNFCKSRIIYVLVDPYNVSAKLCGEIDSANINSYLFAFWSPNLLNFLYSMDRRPLTPITEWTIINTRFCPLIIIQSAHGLNRYISYILYIYIITYQTFFAFCSKYISEGRRPHYLQLHIVVAIYCRLYIQSTYVGWDIECFVFCKLCGMNI